jgi:hypothetical protein
MKRFKVVYAAIPEETIYVYAPTEQSAEFLAKGERKSKIELKLISIKEVDL